MTRKTTTSGSISRRRLLATAIAGAVATLGLISNVGAQQPPIKIGMSMPQTGGLAGGGKASLLGIEIWRGLDLTHELQRLPQLVRRQFCQLELRGTTEPPRR